MKSKPSSREESLRFKSLIQELGLPLRRLPDIIEQKPEVCLAWWSLANSDIKISEVHFERMSKIVGIAEDRLFDGSYDQDLARKRIFGDHQSLPERYSSHQNSFIRTSSHILRYVTLTRGQNFADQVVTSLNVSPLIYKNPDTKINMTYFADLLEILSKKGFSQTELDTLSSVIFLSLTETALGSKFRNAENTYEVYKTLAENFHQFDSNFEYKNKFVRNKYVVRTVLDINQHKGLQNNSESLQRLMRYRHILSAWFPYLAGLNPIFPKVEVIRSTSGILETEYEFTLSTIKRRSSLHAL